MSKVHDVAAKTGKKLSAASTAQLAEMAQTLKRQRDAQKASAAPPQTGGTFEGLRALGSNVRQQLNQNTELRRQIEAAQPRSFADFNSAQELYNFRLQNTRENADGNAVSKAIQADLDAYRKNSGYYNTAAEMERINAQYAPEDAVYTPEQIAAARLTEQYGNRYADDLDALYAQRIGEEENIRRSKKIQSYENVRNNADYSQRVALGKSPEAESWGAYYNKRSSQEHGRGAQEFSSVNRKSYAKDYTKQLANPAEWAVANAEFLLEVDIKGDIDKGESTADYGLSEPLYLYMTPEQRDVYSYYVATGGRKKADEYFDSIKKDLREVRNEARSAYQQEWAAEEPVAAFVARTVNQLGTLGNIPETIRQEFNNSALFGDGIDRPLDTSVAAFDASRRSEAYAQGITSNVDSEFGKFMLNVGFSLSDNAVAAGAGLILGPAASAALLSAESGSAALYEAGERGLSPTEASKLAVVTGGWEYLTEKIAFDELFDLVKVAPQRMTTQKVLNILKQSGVEASEEYANSLLSTMTERAVLGGNSAYDQYVREMQMQGASYEEAVEAANLQFYWLQPLESAAAGAMSGGIMGTSGTVVSGIANRNQPRMTDEQRIAASTIAGIAQRGNDGTATIADTVAEKIITGQQPTNSEIRQLQNATTTIQRSFESMTGIEIVGVDSSNLRASIAAAVKNPALTMEQAAEYTGAVNQMNAQSAAPVQNTQPAAQYNTLSYNNPDASAIGTIDAARQGGAPLDVVTAQDVGDASSVAENFRQRQVAQKGKTDSSAQNGSIPLSSRQRWENMTAGNQHSGVVDLTSTREVAEIYNAADKEHDYILMSEIRNELNRRGENELANALIEGRADDIIAKRSTDNEGNELTDEQLDYFKDSKVRDKNGKLLKMYHGSLQSFTVFDRNKSRTGFLGYGSYFISDREYAEEYRNGGDMYEVYLDIKNPCDADAPIDKTRWRKVFDKLGLDSSWIDGVVEGAPNDVAAYIFKHGQNGKTVSASEWTDAMKSVGWDGWISRQGVSGSGVMAVTFDPAQVKHTDNRNPTENEDIRFSARRTDSAQRDAAYLRAVDNGETLDAREMLHDAAKAAMPDTKIVDRKGDPLMVYHGTNTGDFSVFDAKRTGQSSGDLGYFGKGFYFARSFYEAYEYGRKRVIPAYLNITNPFNFGQEMDVYDGKKPEYGRARSTARLLNVAAKFPKIAAKTTITATRNGNQTSERISLAEFAREVEGAIGRTGSIESALAESFSDIDIPEIREIVLANIDEFTDELKARGHDGVIQSDTGEEIVAFYPEQIKSAELVTYDDAGEEIPLSERFNPESDDIRFRLTGSQYNAPALEYALEEDTLSDAQLANLTAQLRDRGIDLSEDPDTQELLEAVDMLDTLDPGFVLNITEKQYKTAEQKAAEKAAREKAAADRAERKRVAEAEKQRKAEEAEQKKAAVAERRAKTAAKKAAAEAARTDKRINKSITDVAKEHVVSIERVAGKHSVRIVNPEGIIRSLDGDAKTEFERHYDSVSEFGKAFGHRVRFFTGEVTGADGTTFGLYHNGEVYVNVDNIRAAGLKTVAHEICHDIAAQEPSFVNSFYRLYREYCESNGMMNEFNRRWNDIYNNAIYPNKQLAIAEEVLAEMFGERASGDSEFLNYCLGKRPGIITRIVEAFNRILTKLHLKKYSKASADAMELRNFLLGTAARYQMNQTGREMKLSAGIRSDYRSAQRKAEAIGDRYVVLGDSGVNLAEWDTTGLAAPKEYKNLKRKAPDEVTNYGFKHIPVSGERRNVLIVNPTRYVTEGVHADMIASSRSLASALGVRLGFISGDPSTVIGEGKNTREQLLDRDFVLADDGTVYINLDSEVPYTKIVAGAWWSQYRKAHPAAAANLERLAERTNALSGDDKIAQSYAVGMLTRTNAQGLKALNLNPETLVEKLSDSKSAVYAFAHEKPGVIRKMFENIGDVVAKLTKKQDYRAAYISGQLQARLMKAFSETSPNRPGGNKIETAKRKTGPDGVWFMYAGENAQTANRSMLKQAQDMIDAGVEPETVRQETGWFKGMDGRWRFEIDDSKAQYYRAGDARFSRMHADYARHQTLLNKMLNGQISPDEHAELRKLDEVWGRERGRLNERVDRGNATLDEILDHEALFEAYPELRNVKVRFEVMYDGKRGSYDRKSNTIKLSSDLRDAPEDTLLHEIQHAVQSIEGHSGGASPFYWAAEISAEEITRRLDEERREILSSLDRSDANKYARFEDLDLAMETMLAREDFEDNFDLQDHYEKLEAESDELYRELHSREWFRRLQDIRRQHDNQSEIYSNMYRDTAGEIEARDTAARRSLTPEQRKNTRPDIDRTDVVFVDSDLSNSIVDPTDEVKFSARRDNNAVLREPTRTERRAWLDDYADTYGQIPEGEDVNSRGNQRIPRRIDSETKTRQTYRTYAEALTTPDDFVGTLEQEIVDGRASYTPLSNKAAAGYAERKLAEGMDEAMATWNAVTHGDIIADKNQIALGERLIMEAINNRDVKLFTKLVAEVAAEATRAGQMVQAISMVKRLSPEGQLISFRKEVSKLNESLANRKGHPQITPDETLTQEYMDIASELESVRQEISDLERTPENRRSERQQDTIDSLETQEKKLEQQLKDKKNEMITDAAEQVPPTWMDKLRAWRYLAMLGNPRTHIRNLLGNAVFIPAVRIKQGIAGAIERVSVKPGERTQGIIASKELRDFAREDAKTQLDILAAGGKYNQTDAITAEQKPFDDSKVIGKTLNKLADINSAALEGEDAFFLRKHYEFALSRFAAANKWTVEYLKRSSEALAKARGFAYREAQRATYRDLSSFAQLMSKVSNKLSKARGFGKLGYMMFEGAMPFKKTPCNIMKRGIEYSPLGIASAISKGAIMLRDRHNGVQSDYSGTDFINDLSAGMTGTMIMGLGYLLTSLGMLHGRDKDEEDEINAIQGVQEYSVIVGGHSYTVDWVTPVAFPLFVGSELCDQISADRDGYTMDDFYDSLAGIAEPLFSLSMMDGIQSMMQSYSSEGAIFEAGVSAAESYVGQYFPTLSGQLARTVTPEVHSSSYRDKTDAMPDFLSGVTQKAMAKIPGAYGTLPEMIDVWGRNVGAGESWQQRAAENFLSPGYLNRIEVTDADRLVQDLYRETGDAAVIPGSASKYFTIDGERYDMSPDEYVAYAKTRGKTSYGILTEFYGSNEFRHLTPEQQISCVETAYKFATAIAKSQTNSGYVIDTKWQREAYDAFLAGETTLAKAIIEYKTK